jgi:hypothetical protein
LMRGRRPGRDDDEAEGDDEEERDEEEERRDDRRGRGVHRGGRRASQNLRETARLEVA